MPLNIIGGRNGNYERNRSNCTMVGVPCVCLGAVMWYVNELDIRQREERKSWYEKHDQESTKWVDALNNNTKVITELLTIVKEKEN